MSNDMVVSSNYFDLPFIFKERINSMEYSSNSNMPSADSLNQKTDSKQINSPSVNSVIPEGSAKIRPNKGRFLKNVIFSQDFRDVKEGIFRDIVEPKIKNLSYSIIESVINTIDNSFQMMIFGDARPGPSRRTGDRVSYNQMSGPTRKSAPSTAPTMSMSYNADQIAYETRGKATAVLYEMKEHLLDGYPFVTVAQMYEFSGLTTPNWALTGWGWTNLDGVEVKRTFDGDYIIDLPKARPVNR